MKFCYKDGEIELHNGYVQLMLDCLAQWAEGEFDPDEEDAAVDLRNDLLNDFDAFLRGEKKDANTSTRTETNNTGDNAN